MMQGHRKLAVIALVTLFALGRYTILAEELELLSGETVSITEAEAKYRDTCQKLMEEAMATNGNYDALKKVLTRQYYEVNPGPFVVCKDIETDSEETFISLHPFNPLQGVPYSDWDELYLGKGDTAEEVDEMVDAQMANDKYAINNTGSYFYADLPVKQKADPSSLTLEGVSTTDRYFLVSGAVNTSYTGPGEDFFVCHCPFTQIPEEPRNNTNFPQSVDTTEASSAVSTVFSLFGLLTLAIVHFA